MQSAPWQVIRETWLQGNCYYLVIRKSEASSLTQEEKGQKKNEPGSQSRVSVYSCAENRIQSLRLGGHEGGFSWQGQKTPPSLGKVPHSWGQAWGSCLCGSKASLVSVPCRQRPCRERLSIMIPVNASLKTLLLINSGVHP